MRFVDHITIDGKTYYTGTVFMTSGIYAGYVYKNFEMTFICYDTQYDKVRCEMSRFAGTGPYYGGSFTVEQFKNKIISVKEERNEPELCPVEKKKSDTQIDGLFIGWLWYIVLMAVSTIFKDRIGLWALWTFIFFTWRAKKLKKEGTYYE